MNNFSKAIKESISVLHFLRVHLNLFRNAFPIYINFKYVDIIKMGKVLSSEGINTHIFMKHAMERGERRSLGGMLEKRE